MDPQTTQYSQHVGIAFHKYTEYVTAAADFERKARRGQSGFRAVTREDIIDDAELLDPARHAQHRAQEMWGEIWEQLDSAREIAHRMGRDTTMYDETRTISRKHGAGASLDVGSWTHASGSVYTRSLTFDVGPPDLVQHAMAVLLATVPEAKLPEVSNEPVPDLGTSKLGLRVIGVLALAIVIAIVIGFIKIAR